MSLTCLALHARLYKYCISPVGYIHCCTHIFQTVPLTLLHMANRADRASVVFVCTHQLMLLLVKFSLYCWVS